MLHSRLGLDGRWLRVSFGRIVLLAMSIAFFPAAPASAARCEAPSTTTFLAGVEDGFGGGNDPASPGSALNTYFSRLGVTPKAFDDRTPNRYFGHTFSGLPTGICGATLRISVCADGSQPENDALLLDVKADNSFAWHQQFPALVEPWFRGICREFSLDLADLPPGIGNSQSSLLDSLADGQLDVVIQDDTSIDFAELTVQHCPPVACASPPRGIKAWWPLDEKTANTSAELTQKANGTWNGNLTPIAGKIAGALAFDGAGSHVAVPNGPAVDFGTGDFSIDFWMRSTQSSGIHALLEKRVLSPQALGWTVFLSSGRLAFQMAEGGSSFCDTSTATGCTNWDSGATVTDGAWKFITITVDRDQPDGLKFWVNGQLISSHNPTLRQSSLANNAPLYLGRHADGQVGKSYQGDLDEVELFDRALAQIEFLTVLDAPGGKCKSKLIAQWDVSSCSNVSTVTARPRLCNDGSEDIEYGLRFSPLVSGNGCSANGPTQFALKGGQPVLVPAGSCVDLELAVTKPANLATRELSCFKIEAEDLLSGQVTTGKSSFYNNGAICCFPRSPASQLPFPNRVPISFDVFNTSNAASAFNYRLESMSDDGSPSVLTLDGGAAGNAVTGQVMVPAQGQSTFSVDVGMTEFQPFGRQDLLVRDLDTDGVLASRAFSSFVPGCVPDAETLCLNGGRFEVKVIWRDFIGQSGRGFGAMLTSDTGYFWFFSPDNIEVVLKVLDARTINDQWWVFYGALSTVEYTITVRDTTTGESKTYFNPSGNLASVGDIEALPGYEPTALAALDQQLRLEASRLGLGPATPELEASPVAMGTCVPSATTLCVQNNRFRVEVAWFTPAAGSGVGKAITLTNETGYFWFFSPNNVELVLKVLDGGAINSKWWVFYGALSDVQYTVTVTDTISGLVKVYQNPAGNLGSIADIDAFPQ